MSGDSKNVVLNISNNGTGTKPSLTNLLMGNNKKKPQIIIESSNTKRKMSSSDDSEGSDIAIVLGV